MGAAPFGAVSRSLREAGRTIRDISTDVARGKVQRGKERLGLATLRQAGERARGELDVKRAKLEREERLDEPVSFFTILDEAKKRGRVPEGILNTMGAAFRNKDPLAPEGDESLLGDTFTTRRQFIKQFIDMQKLAKKTKIDMDKAAALLTGQKEVAGIKAGVKAGVAKKKEEKKTAEKKTKSLAAQRKEKKRRIQTLESEKRRINVRLAKARADVADETVIQAIESNLKTVNDELKQLKEKPKDVVPDIKLKRTRKARRGGKRFRIGEGGEATQISGRSGKDITKLNKFLIGPK